MKREEIKKIFPDATDEQLKQILDINGSDVEKAKGKAPTLEVELKEKTDALDKLNTEFEKLKEKNASAEDWKARYNVLKAENDAKEEKAKADRDLKEKEANVSSRFDAAADGKEWNHNAIRGAYLKKFGEALESKDYEGKSDKDIFHALTKDDATAFKGVTKVELAGGTDKGTGGEIDDAKIREVMGLPNKQ